MRSVGTKIFATLAAAGMVLVGLGILQTWLTFQSRAEALTASKAELALQFDRAIRSYVSETVRPLMQAYADDDEFIPQAMSSSYAARTVFQSVQKALPDYIIKFSSDNPRNPVNAAGPEELQILQYFRQHPEADKWTGRVRMNGQDYFVHSIPRRMEVRCLQCHGRPEDAPKSLLATYGSKAGFHRSLNEVVALDVVGIPVGKVDAAVAADSRAQLVALGMGLVVFAGVFVLVFRWFVSSPLAAIATHFQKAAAQPDGTVIAPIEVARLDEIGILATSFNALAERLNSLHSLLEQRVEARTALLEAEIVERRRMERTLRLTQFFVDHTADAVFWLDPQGKIVYANQRACHALGYSSTELCAMTVCDIDAAFTPQRWAQHWEEIRYKKSFVIESLHRTRDGELIPVEIAVNHIEFEGKEYDCAFARDITERKRAEAELARFSAIVNSSQDAIIGATLEGIVTSWNPGAERLYGYTAAEMIGRSIRVLPPPDRVDEVCRSLERVRRGEHIKPFETIRCRKDGTLIDVSLALSPIRDSSGATIGLSAIIHSIADRKRAEDALRQSEEKYRGLLEACPDAVLISDLSGHVLFASRQASELAGVADAKELIGQSLFAFVIPDDRQRLAMNLAELDTGVRRNIEFTVLRRDQATVPVEVSLVVLRDVDGRVKAVMGAIRDITCRKDAEKKLAEGKQAAEAANRAKSEFLANMSHEIRTPMTAILGYLDLLSEACPKTCDGYQSGISDPLEVIRHNADHLLRLIDDVLDLSKIEAGKVILERTRCSPYRIVVEVLSLMQVRATAKALSLDMAFEGFIPESMESDPTRLRQILLNLVGNAIKFTEVGGVRIVTSFSAAESGRPMLQIQVRDTGIGMSEENQAAIFRPFTQADASTTRRFGGTGLGLTISKRLAQLLGGDIAVTSAEGKGSTFTVSIPTGPLEGIALLDMSSQFGHIAKDDDPRKTQAEAMLPAGCRVLLAEDGPDNRRLIALLLRKAGAEVVLAENGQQALELVGAAQQEARPFDAILMDMQMPVMDGYGASRKLREAGYTMPVIALTAHAMAGDREKCLEAGCSDYLAKPIDRVALLEMMARWIARPPQGKSEAESDALVRIAHQTR